MQKSWRLQPLTLSHVSRQHEEGAWSSDSDSGITVDSHSHSPPSKSTPDSGIGAEPLSWQLSSSSSLPPPPSSPPSSSVEGMRMEGGGRGVAASDRLEYDHSSRVEYDREHVEGVSEDGDVDRFDRPDPKSHMYVNLPLSGSGAHSPASSQRGHAPSEAPPTHPVDHTYVNDAALKPAGHASQTEGGAVQAKGGTMDYVTLQMIGGTAVPVLADRRRSQEKEETPPLEDEFDLDSPDADPVDLELPDLDPNDIDPRDLYLGDEGYSTDSRSFATTTSLSSSLSSIMTDSSGCPSNGWQPRNGAGASGGRGQPVAGQGRLVIARRCMLVKRRDLPAVETSQSVSLEERLRALTTIQEEDSPPSQAHTDTGEAGEPHQRRAEQSQREADRFRQHPSKSKSGLGVSSDGQMLPEGLYSVINKRSNRVTAPTGDPDEDGATRDGRGYGIQRAVPVTLGPQGVIITNNNNNSNNNNSKNTGNRFHESSGSVNHSSDSDTGVRFKVGGGGVKLNKSGKFEIDYSYYMKGSPSDSKDAVNTYTPQHDHAHSGHVTRESGAGADLDSALFKKRTAPRPQQLPLQDPAYTRQSAPHSRGGREGSEEQGCSGRRVSSSSEDNDMSVASEPVYMNVNPSRDSSWSRSDRTSSLPDLSWKMALHGKSRESGRRAGHREVDSDVVPPLSSLPYPLPHPSSGHPQLARLAEQHRDRNSCDVGSLYHQSELNSTFPPQPAGGAGRLSLNLRDLPTIQQQLLATSQMLSSGKRHQFASSSDIYNLFQGHRRGKGEREMEEEEGVGVGVPLGRQAPLRHSVHSFSSPHPGQGQGQGHAQGQGRIPRGPASPRVGRASVAPADQSSVLFSRSGPVRASHDLFPPESLPGFTGPGHVTGSLAAREAYLRDLSARAGNEREAAGLRERLERGQQFVTDVIQDYEGEKLSTLV